MLFHRDDSARLADFGVALLAESTRITRIGVAVGTASFVAPEQLAPQEAVGPAADVYSLGLVLLESLTGARAFSGTSAQAALERLTRSPAIPDDLPDAWSPLLRRMTAREPVARPVAADLAGWLADGTVDLPNATQVLPAAGTPDTMPLAGNLGRGNGGRGGGRGN